MKYDLGDKFFYQKRAFIFLGLGCLDSGEDYMVVEEAGKDEVYHILVQDVINYQEGVETTQPVKTVAELKVSGPVLVEPQLVLDPEVVEVLDQIVQFEVETQLKPLVKKRSAKKPGLVGDKPSSPGGRRFSSPPKMVVAKALSYNVTKRYKVNQQLRHYPFYLKNTLVGSKPGLPTQNNYQIGVVGEVKTRHQPVKKPKLAKVIAQPDLSAAPVQPANGGWYELISKYRMEK